jgi:predicted CXXCH cytochrome family protein
VRLGCWGALALLCAAGAGAAQAAENRCVPREARNTFQGAVVHAPVAEGRCAACHGPHESERQRLLREDVPALCIGCHDQPMKDAEGRSRPSVKSLFEDAALPPEDEGRLNLHKPFADGDCTCCHDPHASSNHRLLNERHIGSFYVNYAPDRFMCFHCHDERAFAEARTLEATNFRNGNLNLHHRHVNRAKGRACTVCHEYHASRLDALIREETPFGTHRIRISAFERTETGGSCAPSCHVAVEYDRLLPALNPIGVTPREGEDASDEELREALERQKAGAAAPDEGQAAGGRGR